MIKHRNSYGITLCDIDQIKQDLEVLEIIRKKNVNIEFFKTIIEGYLIEGTLIIYNEQGYQKLTLEEVIKVKQWLEENQ